jgi:23S rRNA (guanosine2251-2'-O)-methyltransferase
MSTRLVYGIQAVRQALARGSVERLYLQSDLGAARVRRLGVDEDARPVNVQRCPAGTLARLTGTTKHQGVAATVRWRGPMAEREARDYVAAIPVPLVLALDGVQDPRNYGALLRTAEAAGADLVVIARSRNVGLTPVVSKVAAGAAEVQPIAEVGNLARFLGCLREAGLRILGADDSATASLFDVDLTPPLAIVVGAEGEGLRRLTRERCDALVSLPMCGVVESLNVAVAAGICLYEARRQRRLAPVGTLR